MCHKLRLKQKLNEEETVDLSSILVMTLIQSVVVSILLL